MTLNLKLTINVKADIENAKYFVKQGRFVDWFLPPFFQYIMSKNFSFSERNKIITEYTKHIYKLKSKEIIRGVAKTRKRWKEIGKDYYKLVDHIFQGYHWPKGQYTGIASIYLMYPRDISKKNFYFPFTKANNDPLGVIAHEMLHFIFFDFIKKKYGINENSKFKGKNTKYIWQISETFNTIIENWKPYKKILNSKTIFKPYPECEKIYQSMSQQWNQKHDINKLLDKWLLKENFYKSR